MKRRNMTSRNAAARHAGFTMIEILISITIIGILASIVLGALQQARETAKASKTRSLVTRLHYVIMAKLDSYSTRRVSMDLQQYVQHPSTPYGPPHDKTWSQALPRARVNAIRDLMRMEMPDRWSDVFDGPLLVPWMTRPAVSRRYSTLYDRVMLAAGGDPVKEGLINDNGAAELLYMIVMNIPDAAEQFHASEIGDIDGDGLNEFHDGWGRPIRFIRWPSGFISDYHANTDLQTGIPYNPTVPDTQPDPFDPQCVVSAGQGAFPLYPLIYSAGPDKEYDINRGTMAGGGNITYKYSLDGGNLDPFAPDENSLHVGRPINDDTGSTAPGDLRHYDNIHNHVLDSAQER